MPEIGQKSYEFGRITNEIKLQVPQPCITVISQKEFNTYSKSSISRGHTPASMTAWILSFVPSERYESAQHASVKTSSSLEWIRRARAGSAGLTY